MSSVDWIFRKKLRTETERNPTTGEHFRRSSERGAASMLVREAVQNALDARHPRLPKGEPVRVRIYVSGAEIAAGAIPISRLRVLVTPTLQSHLEAERSGVLHRFHEDTVCPYLVVEDFGTTGLTGDVLQSETGKRNSRNPFYFFLRAEGANDKIEGSRGSWGVGKTVFPSSSRINTFFAASVRSEDHEVPFVLMGRTILRFHSIRGETWLPDAWYGVPDGEDRFPLPLDREAGEPLLRIFNTQRGVTPGLSVIVPFIDVDEMTPDSLMQAMIEEWSFCIADGSLVAEIEGPNGVRVIDSDSLGSFVAELPQDTRRVAVEQLVRAAEEIVEVRLSRKTAIELLNPWPYRDSGKKGAINWQLEWMNEPIRERITGLLRDPGSRVVVKVPVYVEPQEGEPVLSEFFVYLEADPAGGNVRPSGVRAGLVVPGSGSDRPPLVAGYRSVIYAPSGALSDLLRAAEDPSHMTWCHRTELFKERYKYGKSVLSFVRTAPAEIVKLIRGHEDDSDPELFRDLISMAQRGGSGRTQRKRIVRPDVEPKRKRSAMEISRISGGFAVTPFPEGFVPPVVVTIRCAYDCEERDPFSMFEPFDFDFRDSGDVKITSSGGVYSVLDANRLLFKALSLESRLEVSGFDSNRDLIVHSRTNSSDESSTSEGTEV